MSTVSRSLFREMLGNHDWYYAFSDDHRVYSTGRESYYALMDAAKAINCPWPLSVMQNYINGLTITKYYQPDPTKDEWYHHTVTNTRWSMGVTKDMLLTQEEYSKIQSWFGD